MKRTVGSNEEVDFDIQGWCTDEQQTGQDHRLWTTLGLSTQQEDKVRRLKSELRRIQSHFEHRTPRITFGRGNRLHSLQPSLVRLHNGSWIGSGHLAVSSQRGSRQRGVAASREHGSDAYRKPARPTSLWHELGRMLAGVCQLHHRT